MAASLPISPIVQSLLDQAEQRGDELAFRYLQTGESDGPTTTLTWSLLEAGTRRLAAHLLARARPGERVLLQFMPGLDFVVSVLACARAGLVAVPAYPPDPMNAKRSLATFRQIVADCRPAFVLSTTRLMRLVQSMLAREPDLADLTWVACDGELHASAFQAPPVRPNDLAVLQYTSGSTGTPRGVMLSHGNIVEFDSPDNLLRDEKSIFYGMAKDAGLVKAE